MSFTPNFSISQSQGNPNLLTITDTSVAAINTGNEMARVYFQKSDGTYIVPSGTTVNYVQIDNCNAGTGRFPTTTIDILDRDYALTVTVKWMQDDLTINYELTQVLLFKAYSENFDYALVTSMASQPNLVDDAVFLSNKEKVRTYIDSAVQSVSYGMDIVAAQFCLDELYKIITNQAFYF